MRVIFAGTPGFAATALAAILDAGHYVPLVLTQPDRPAGRGLAFHLSPVKQLAVARGLVLHQPASLKANDALAPILEAGADIMVVAAYGLILPQAVLDIPPFGCINIHASLLPRWRGAAPIQRAILGGDAETGITIMQMDAGLDTGPIMLSQSVVIAPEDTTGSLQDALAHTGATMVVEALRRLSSDGLTGATQSADGVTYAAKITKEEARLDWRKSAVDLARIVRAFNPAPGATAELNAQTLKVWRAYAEPGKGDPGVVLDACTTGVMVACGEGLLRITEIQKPGGRRLSAGDFLRGTSIAPGSRFALSAG
jgi:methionyl-tRNA formyltransferase